MNLESAPSLDQRSRLLSRARLYFGIGTTAAACLFAGNARPASAEAPQAVQPHLVKYIGIATNEIWVPDETEAEKVAENMADSGVNAFEIYQPLSPGQGAEIINDAPRTCAAVKAGDKYGLTPFITMIGSKKRDKKPNKPASAYAPVTVSDYRRFADTIGALIWTLSGPNGCAKNVHNINVGILNEINSPYFYPQEFDDPDDSAGAHYENMLEYIYPRAKQSAIEVTEALKQASENPDEVEPITVNLIAANFASNHNLLGTLTDMGETKLKNSYFGKSFDTLGVHPYMENSSVPPNTPHPNGRVIGIADYDKLRPLINKYFGNVPVLYSEFGIETRTPKDKPYTGKVPLSVKPVSELVQADYWSRAIGLVACQENVEGIFNFLRKDDWSLNLGWQSGFYFADGTPKTSLPVFRQANIDAGAGNLSNCA